MVNGLFRVRWPIPASACIVLVVGKGRESHRQTHVGFGEMRFTLAPAAVTTRRGACRALSMQCLVDDWCKVNARRSTVVAGRLMEPHPAFGSQSASSRKALPPCCLSALAVAQSRRSTHRRRDQNACVTRLAPPPIAWTLGHSVCSPAGKVWGASKQAPGRPGTASWALPHSRLPRGFARDNADRSAGGGKTTRKRGGKK